MDGFWTAATHGRTMSGNGMGLLLGLFWTGRKLAELVWIQLGVTRLGRPTSRRISVSSVTGTVNGGGCYEPGCRLCVIGVTQLLS